MSRFIFEIVIILLFISSNNFSRTIDAGGNQIINWEKTHYVQLKGSVSQNKIKVKWTCPQNSKGLGSAWLIGSSCKDIRLKKAITID